LLPIGAISATPHPSIAKRPAMIGYAETTSAPTANDD
jgi:hypothetical protein